MQPDIPKMFSTKLPDFQLIWDSSSLTPLMQCPRRYELSVLRGYTRGDDSNDLLFGSLYHAGIETFYRAITAGESHDAALKRALRVVLMQSWDFEHDRPFMGVYETVWRCTGVTKFKNAKGNAAKCPFSHKGKYFPAPGPETCSCGSPTETLDKWYPIDPAKDRVQLLRAIVWYTEEVKGGPFKIVSYLERDEEGKEEHTALVEIPWRIDFIRIGEEVVQLAGNCDAIKTPDGLGAEAEVYTCDYKTTRSALTGMYFSQFEPNVQVGVYGSCTPRVVPDLPVAGVLIEAIQTLQSGVIFSSRVFRFTDAQAADFTNDLEHWIGQAYEYARKGHWPRNQSACRLCGYKDVCSRESASQNVYLEANFERNYWNPLTRARQKSRPS